LQFDFHAFDRVAVTVEVRRASSQMSNSFLDDVPAFALPDFFLDAGLHRGLERHPCGRLFLVSASAWTDTLPGSTAQSIFCSCPRIIRWLRFFAAVDTAIMGRKTLDAGLKMSGGSLPHSNMPMYVFSTSRPPGERDGVIFVNDTPASFIGKVRERPGKDIWLMGGGELARAFLNADLVDRLHLGVVPVLLGAGIPLFPSGFPQRDFRLIENKTFSKGLISLLYERSRPRRKPKV
jgi:dihydrofolate reductase